MDRDIKPQSEERRCRALDSDCAASRVFGSEDSNTHRHTSYSSSTFEVLISSTRVGAIEEVAADRD